MFTIKALYGTYSLEHIPMQRYKDHEESGKLLGSNYT